MGDYLKPLPHPDVYSIPFWEYVKKHEFRMQQCSNCGRIRYPPSPICDECLSEDYDWKELSGQGEIFSFVIFHKAYFKGFEDDMPYNVITVKLDEGPLFISNLKGVKNEDIKIGSRVRVVFEDVTDEYALPKFELIS